MVVLQLLILGVWTGCIYALVALGLALTRSTYGFFNFAIGGVIVSGGYGALVSMRAVADSSLVGVAAAITAGCCLAVACEIIVYRPLRRLSAPPLVLMLCSLGILIVIENALALFFGDQRMLLQAAAPRTVDLLGTRLSTTQVVAMIVGIALVPGVLVLARTKVGMMIRAVACDPELALSTGVSLDRLLLVVTLITGLVGGLAGFLWASDNDLMPTSGFRPLLYGIVGALVGGSRNMLSPILGGLLVGVVANLCVWQIPTEWRDSVALLLLVIIVLARPRAMPAVSTTRPMV